MTLRALTDGEWADLIARRPGAGIYGVITTGIYCRFGCPSRPPKRENACLLSGPEEAETHGFRACKRCGARP